MKNKDDFENFEEISVENQTIFLKCFENVSKVFSKDWITAHTSPARFQSLLVTKK